MAFAKPASSTAAAAASAAGGTATGRVALGSGVDLSSITRRKRATSDVGSTGSGLPSNTSHLARTAALQQIAAGKLPALKESASASWLPRPAGLTLDTTIGGNFMDLTGGGFSPSSRTPKASALPYSPIASSAATGRLSPLHKSPSHLSQLGGGRSPTAALTMVDRSNALADAALVRKQRDTLAATSKRLAPDAAAPTRPLTAAALSPKGRSHHSTGNLVLSPSAMSISPPRKTLEPVSGFASPASPSNGNPGLMKLPTSPTASGPHVSSFAETGHIPGYAGHVRGYDHVAGRPFSRATRRALRRDPVTLAVGEGVPSSPQAFSKIPNKNDTLPGHIPGYSGHVTDYSSTCGKSFTRCTADCPNVNLAGRDGLTSKIGRKVLNVRSVQAQGATKAGLAAARALSHSSAGRIAK